MVRVRGIECTAGTVGGIDLLQNPNGLRIAAAVSLAHHLSLLDDLVAAVCLHKTRWLALFLVITAIGFTFPTLGHDQRNDIETVIGDTECRVYIEIINTPSKQRSHGVMMTGSKKSQC